jgi:hypothetical protein
MAHPCNPAPREEEAHLKNKSRKTRDRTQMVSRLTSICKALGSVPKSQNKEQSKEEEGAFRQKD